MSRLRFATGEEARPVRRIHRLHRLSEVQVHPREDAGHQVPEVRDRRTDWSGSPRKDAGASSTAATNIPNAISRRRTCRSPSRARNAARRSSSRSAASWARCEPASRKVAIGKRLFRKPPPQPFPNPWAQPSPERRVPSQIDRICLVSWNRALAYSGLRARSREHQRSGRGKWIPQ